MPQGWDLEELGGVKSARPSPPKPLVRNPTKFGVCVTHMNAACNSTFFARGPWEGVKRLYIIKFQLQSRFQRIFKPTLNVFSQIKDIKHIECKFIRLPGACPRGDFGELEGGIRLSVRHTISRWKQYRFFIIIIIFQTWALICPGNERFAHCRKSLISRMWFNSTVSHV